MAKVSVLVDTDVFIDYFNTGRFSSVFDSSRFIGLLLHRDQEGIVDEARAP